MLFALYLNVLKGVDGNKCNINIFQLYFLRKKTINNNKKKNVYRHGLKYK